jgi:hypothetical protein
MTLKSEDHRTDYRGSAVFARRTPWDLNYPERALVRVFINGQFYSDGVWSDARMDEAFDYIDGILNVYSPDLMPQSRRGQVIVQRANV